MRSLVAPQNPAQAVTSCQRVMNQCGLLQTLTGLLMASGVPVDILTDTINTVSDMIRGNMPNQEFFASMMAPSTPPRYCSQGVCSVKYFQALLLPAELFSGFSITFNSLFFFFLSLCPLQALAHHSPLSGTVPRLVLYCRVLFMPSICISLRYWFLIYHAYVSLC